MPIANVNRKKRIIEKAEKYSLLCSWVTEKFQISLFITALYNERSLEDTDVSSLASLSHYYFFSKK